jgi:pimeloyl-ACP methyl ester carboxylesterase
MSYTTSSDGARIHYETHGTGDPVLLIMGLGSNAYGWHRTIPWLSERYQVIAFDNPGTGRSDVPARRPSVAAASAAICTRARWADANDVVRDAVGAFLARASGR